MLEFYTNLFTNPWLCWILLIVWFVLLVKGAGLLVDGSGSIATKYGISQLVIWLTVVAFGTSMPELVVNVVAAMKWDPDTLSIAVSGILGSNLSNILLILWVTAAIYPLKMVSSTVYREIPFSLLAILVLFLLMSDQFINGWAMTESILFKNEALVMLGIFVIFLYYTYYLAKSGKVKLETSLKLLSMPKSVILIFLWLLGLVAWGNLVISSAVSIAESIGMSPAIIGLTIVALGTSLPELATSIVAAYRKSADMAVWNIVWSNIFNIVWILWVTWVISDLPTYDWFYKDIAITIFATILLFVLSHTGKKFIITRPEWIIMATMYVSYIFYVVVTNI